MGCATPGWDSPFGEGRVFVLDEISFLESSLGFDLDGACRAPGACVDNLLGAWTPEWNDAAARALAGGEATVLIELVGLTELDAASDAISVRVYHGRDADQPPRPANDFQTPPGETTCCEFEVDASAVAGEFQQPRARSPARLDGSRVQSLVPFPVDLPVALWGAQPNHGPFPIIRVERARLSLELEPDGGAITSGVLGGGIVMAELGRIVPPECAPDGATCPASSGADGSLLDRVVAVAQPDLDLDIPPDGLERLELGPDGRVLRCFDGDGSEVFPITPGASPWLCAEHPKMADGFSIALRFRGVPAAIRGVARD